MEKEYTVGINVFTSFVTGLSAQLASIVKDLFSVIPGIKQGIEKLEQLLNLTKQKQGWDYTGMVSGDFVLYQGNFILEKNSTFRHTPETHNVINLHGNIIDGIAGRDLINSSIITYVKTNPLSRTINESSGLIKGGDFMSNVENLGTISGGNFKFFVTNENKIENGDFLRVTNKGYINNGNFIVVENEKNGVINGGKIQKLINHGGTINNVKADGIETIDGKIENVESNYININDGKAQILNSKINFVNLENKAILKTNSQLSALGNGYIEKNGLLYDLNGNNIIEFTSDANDNYDNLSGISLIKADGKEGYDTLKLDQNSRINTAINYEKIILDGVEMLDKDALLLEQEVGMANITTLNNLANFESFGGYLINNNGAITQVYCVGASQAVVMPQITLIGTLVGNYSLNEKGELILAGTAQPNDANIVY